MMTRLFAATLSALLLAGGATSANAAATVHFDITGGYTAAFDLAANPQPDYSNSTSFDINNVSGSFAGVTFGGPVAPATASTASLVQFYSSSYGGGIGITADGITRFVADGAQLYSGSSSAPTFLAGTYALLPNYGYGASRLTISTITAAVPEPATWAMMLVGFGGIGFGLRRRKTTTRVAYA